MITDAEQLERHLGRAGAARDVKVIPYLDDGAQAWIAEAPLVFVGCSSTSGPRVTIGGVEDGFAAPSADTLPLPRDALDDGDLARIGDGVGTLFLIPGLGETLRVNGRVRAVEAGTIEVAVEECFVHCAKALLRSDFWEAPPTVAVADPVGFLNASRFMALATADADGRADVSPKGDPAGRLIQAEGGEAWFAERPGNRRADGYRNLLTQPRLAATLLVPGSTTVARLSGRAEITDREDVRERFTVKDKAPLLATRIAELQVDLRESEALRRARPWQPRTTPRINGGEVMAQHVRLNRTGGLQAAAARAMVSVPGLMKWGLKSDYKRNLY